jgi:acetyltransferase-like isoleucine patch superfamily enzyme
VETVNGSIVGVSNLRIEKGVEAVNGSIEIGAGSLVGGNVETVNGGITLLAMKVNGNVETVNGNITVGENTVIGGHLKVNKPKGWGMSWGKPKVPRIVLGPNSRVMGDLIFEREVELYAHSSAKYGKLIYVEAEAGKAEALKPIVFSGKEPDFK